MSHPPSQPRLNFRTRHGKPLARQRGEFVFSAHAVLWGQQFWARGYHDGKLEQLNVTPELRRHDVIVVE
jgi:hypothetical protein